MAKVSPFLWFDTEAEEAAYFYISVFNSGDSKVHAVSRGPDGQVLTIKFRLNGQEFVALNGGPRFKFNEAVSFVVECADQAEVDHYWSHLTADGGEESWCGWLKDRYGLSWQIVPKKYMEMMSDPDPAKVSRVFQAMQQMQKFVIVDLQKAYDAEEKE
jgi:predicted 3-demethylubiquinone-9 3-methyltransferase (glyoxalase superfamily)